MSVQETVTVFCDALIESVDASLNLSPTIASIRTWPCRQCMDRKACAILWLLFFAVTGPVRLETHKAVRLGDLVMNERIDHVDPPRGKAFGLPVAGVFEERDGKTSAWCDYFCMRQFSEGTGLTF